MASPFSVRKARRATKANCERLTVDCNESSLQDAHHEHEARVVGWLRLGKEETMQRSTTLSMRHLIRLALLVIAIPASGPLAAQIPQQPNNPLSRLTFRSDELAPSQPIQALESAQNAIPSAAREGWTAFRRTHGEWKASVDERTGLIASAAGPGIPWIPGHGNSLTPTENTP